MIVAHGDGDVARTGLSRMVSLSWWMERAAQTGLCVCSSVFFLFLDLEVQDWPFLKYKESFFDNLGKIKIIYLILCYFMFRVNIIYS